MQVSANAIRIGNWLKSKKKPEGFQVSINGLVKIATLKGDYQPIELSEEWMDDSSSENLPPLVRSIRSIISSVIFILSWRDILSYTMKSQMV